MSDLANGMGEENTPQSVIVVLMTASTLNNLNRLHVQEEL